VIGGLLQQWIGGTWESRGLEEAWTFARERGHPGALVRCAMAHEHPSWAYPREKLKDKELTLNSNYSTKSQVNCIVNTKEYLWSPKLVSRKI
jgi:hypothetical protein